MFNPGFEIGQIVSNADIVNKFKCGNMGGMRRSLTTNTLIIVSDYTKGLYHDKWIGGVLHYTGMGKRGDMDINWAQNVTLAESHSNGVDVHLFEVITSGEYIYCGRVKLVDNPYTETQLDEDNNSRIVWMFPVKPVIDNNVIKPERYTFNDMDDYRARGKNVDIECLKLSRPKNKKRNDDSLKGKKIKHTAFGEGIITKYDGKIITVKFLIHGVKTLNYESCLENALIEFID